VEQSLNNGESKINPLAKALGALLGIKMKDFFEHSFENFRAGAILLSVLMTVTAGSFTALAMIILSATYLITGSFEGVAIAALSLGVVGLGLVIWFFSKVLRRPYWLKIFESEPIVNLETAESRRELEPLNQ
jgi:hypothetical protein